jgi:hypothetical protein
LREFVYTHLLNSGSLDQPTFLGLAEVKIEDKDVAGAMGLLRRMVLITGEPFSGLDPAAALLERTRHPAEASEFLTTIIKAEPWNADAKRRLAEAQGTAPRTTNPWDNLPTDAVAREKALLAIIAADPRTSTPRLLLIRAAIEARHPYLAVAAARAILPQYFREDGPFTDWMAKGFLASFETAERVAVARGLGQAHQALGDSHVALLYFQIAQYIAPSDPTRRSIAAVQTQLELEAKNELRRPVVNDGVEQQRLVHMKEGAR